MRTVASSSSRTSFTSPPPHDGDSKGGETTGRRHVRYEASISRTQRPCERSSLVSAIIAIFLVTYNARAAWEIEPRASPSPRCADRTPRLTSPYCSSTRVCIRPRYSYSYRYMYLLLPQRKHCMNLALLPHISLLSQPSTSLHLSPVLSCPALPLTAPHPLLFSLHRCIAPSDAADHAWPIKQNAGHPRSWHNGPSTQTQVRVTSTSHERYLGIACECKEVFYISRSQQQVRIVY